MEGSSDVRDILEMSGHEGIRSSFMSDSGKKAKKAKKLHISKPEGMARELWGLLWTDNMDAPPVIQTESTSGYKSMKAKLGSSKVRPWEWMAFQNPARKDAAVFYHWRRKADEHKDYPFAAFNKRCNVMLYTDSEYNQHLSGEDWTRNETDHLMSLAQRFDLRFVVMQDRWDRDRFNKRSVEDLKERYYHICNILTRVRAPVGQDARTRIFDADHERRRKQQLCNLYDRTEEQVEEEQTLLAELRKIETRKKEREKKTADLQKLITAAESSEQRPDKKQLSGGIYKKKVHHLIKKDSSSATPDSTGIKFPEMKTAGVTLRSQRLKLPNSVGQKKTKALEQVLEELGVDLNPTPTDAIVTNYNELRQDIVLLYELKLALANCEYELQTQKHRLQTLAPDRTIELPATLNLDPKDESAEQSEDGTSERRSISETIDLLGATTPNRKRRAALEQSNVLKKIKHKL